METTNNTTSTEVNGSSATQTPIPDDKYTAELEILAQEWNTAREADLALRHKTGELLNRKFGSPEQRQKRRDGGLGEAAKKLGITTGELSRLRWFAARFESIQDFRRQHPDVKTWSAVRELLASLSNKAKGGDGSLNGPSPADKLKKAFDGLSSSLREVTSLSEEERKAVLDSLRKLAQSFADCLRVQVSVVEGIAAATPPLPAKSEAEAANAA